MALNPKRVVLPNGLVLLVSERRALPIVAVSAYVRAGAVLDPPGSGGLANLTAELLTRGTARRTAAELDRAIESVGGSIGAGGGRDGAAVSLGVLSKDLPLGLDLLAEVLTQPVFPEDEVKRKIGEIQVALQNAETEPDSVAGRALAPLIYGTHPYANPTPGTVQSVATLDRAQVVRFHRDHYRPDATVVTVVGDVSAAEMRAALTARLGAWRPPATPLPTIPLAPLAMPAVSRTITRELTQATILLGRPAIRQRDPDYPALVVATYVLGGGSTSRLYGKVREERGLAYSVGAGAEMRQAMGVAVFAGMIGVTAFGIFLTPVFYVLLRALSGNRPLRHHGDVPHIAEGPGGGAIRPAPAAPVRKEAP